MIEKTCEICSKKFGVQPYRAKTARFCSKSCGGKWHMATRVMRGPSLVGNKLRLGLSPANKGKSSPQLGKKIVKYKSFKCRACNDVFEVVPWIVRQNKTKSGDRFCSKQCHSVFMAEHKSGENSPHWVGGILTYRGRGWLQARALAVSRDKGTCQRCLKFIGKSISVHHIKPFREFSSKDEANSLDNLICLCQPCHMKVERAYDKNLHCSEKNC